MFEYLVIRDLRVYGQPERAEVFHYRDEMGLEIDAVIERDDGAWIAVEVKLSPAREVVDRLAYAVGPECRAVIVVAESHRDEFVAVADEWNRYSEAYGRSGIRLFLVAIEVGRIGDSGPGFRFRLVAGPNEWKSATATGGRPLSEAERVRHSELREFWSGLRDVLRQRGDLAGSGSFSGQVNDITILRKRAFSFQFLMTMESCRVELRIDAYDGDENVRLFYALSERQEEIEEVLGTTLEWINNPSHRANRISWVPEKACGYQTPADERRAGYEAPADAMYRFRDTFMPHIEQLV